MTLNYTALAQPGTQTLWGSSCNPLHCQLGQQLLHPSQRNSFLQQHAQPWQQQHHRGTSAALLSEAIVAEADAALASVQRGVDDLRGTELGRVLCQVGNAEVAAARFAAGYRAADSLTKV